MIKMNCFIRFENYFKKLFEEVLDIETYDLLNAISGKTSYNQKYENIIKQLSNLSVLNNDDK